MTTARTQSNQQLNCNSSSKSTKRNRITKVKTFFQKKNLGVLPLNTSSQRNGNNLSRNQQPSKMTGSGPQLHLIWRYLKQTLPKYCTIHCLTEYCLFGEPIIPNCVLDKHSKVLLKENHYNSDLEVLFLHSCEYPPIVTLYQSSIHLYPSLIINQSKNFLWFSLLLQNPWGTLCNLVDMLFKNNLCWPSCFTLQNFPIPNCVLDKHSKVLLKENHCNSHLSSPFPPFL